jgi:hypothetical protein
MMQKMGIKPISTSGAHQMTEKPDPKTNEIADELMTAASRGENLMREVDYMSGHSSRLKQDVLGKMVGMQDKFPNVKLVDYEGHTITKAGPGTNVARIVRMSGGKEETVYDGSSDAADLMNADRTNIIISDKTTGQHPQDVNAFVEEFKKTIDQLVASGRRLDGEGIFKGIINDAERAYIDNRMYDCADQSVAVLGNLSKLNTSGNWDLHLIGAPPHYKIELVPHSKDDPLIKLDPWRGKSAIDVVPAGKYEPDTRINRWLDSDGRPRWN